MVRSLTAEEFGRVIGGLLQPTALIEGVVLLGCLALSWGLVRLLRGPEPRRGSIWFGRGVVDGVLFPVFALGLALAARVVLAAWVPLAVFRVAVPVLLSLLAIRLAVRVLRVAFPASRAMRIVERSISWLAWIALLLWISGVLPLLLAELDTIRWSIGSTTISVRDLLEGVVTAVVVLILVLWISAALEARLLKGAGDDLSMRKIAANTLRALLLFVGLLVALSAAGIDLTALGVLGGAIGVGVGFGLQKLASNYVSGFVILAERSVRIGDMVKVDGFEGRISDIKTRYTVIRALNGREAIVPNELLITQRVENSSLADTRVLLTTSLQVAYGTEVESLMPELALRVAAVPRVLADPAPVVLLAAFAADGLELRVSFWIDDPYNGQVGVVSAVNLALLGELNARGVEIPFPQRVLHLQAPAGGPEPVPG